MSKPHLEVAVKCSPMIPSHSDTEAGRGFVKTSSLSSLICQPGFSREHGQISCVLSVFQCGHNVEELTAACCVTLLLLVRRSVYFPFISCLLHVRFYETPLTHSQRVLASCEQALDFFVVNINISVSE